jgi:predicted metal-dependent phosphoesterase TrpH
MVLDLHVHTRVGSCDSTIEYDELVPWAKKSGLDGICITEHGNRKTGVAQGLAQAHDFLILEGMELNTEFGDVLIYGVDEVPLWLFRFEDVRAFVQQAGGVMFAAHPFRTEITRPVMRNTAPRITLEEALSRKVFSLVDGLEVTNGWSCQEDIDFSYQVAETLGLKAIGASDAHAPEQIGSCATVFQNGITCEADLLQQLKDGIFTPRDHRPPDRRGLYC